MAPGLQVELDIFSIALKVQEALSRSSIHPEGCLGPGRVWWFYWKLGRVTGLVTEPKYSVVLILGLWSKVDHPEITQTIVILHCFQESKRGSGLLQYGRQPKMPSLGLPSPEKHVLGPLRELMQLSTSFQHAYNFISMATLLAWRVPCFWKRTWNISGFSNKHFQIQCLNFFLVLMSVWVSWEFAEFVWSLPGSLIQLFI